MTVIQKRNGIRTINYGPMQERLIAVGVDPAKIQEMRRQAIAMVRLCDELLFDDKGHTIEERNR